jgi:hypothetical protein
MSNKGEQQRSAETHEQWKRHVDESLVTANDVLKRLLGSWCNTPMDFLPGNMHRLLIEIALDRKEAGTLDAGATQPAVTPSGNDPLPEIIAIGEAWLRGRRYEFNDIRKAVADLSVRSHVFGYDCYFKEEVDAALKPPEDSAIAEAATTPTDVAERARRAAEKIADLVGFDPNVRNAAGTTVADIIASEFSTLPSLPSLPSQGTQVGILNIVLVTRDQES